MSIKGSNLTSTSKVLKFGMVGGGQGAFIGDVHKKGATLDGMAELAAGCFSRTYENTLATGAKWGLSPDRLYQTYQEMAQKEQERPDGIDFAVIVTPNHTHFPAVKAFLEHGIHVLCDKPLALSSEQGEELKALAVKNDLLLGVTYIYTGYPMVHQMRAMIAHGDIGAVRVVSGRYIQGWLATEIELNGSKQASWRCDPNLSGISNATGDLGTHLENLISFVTHLEIDALCANLRPVGEHRTLDNNGEIIIKYKGGATGMMWCSQVAVGYDNDLRLLVCGEKGSIEWIQESPNYLKVNIIGEPTKILSRGNDYFYPGVNALNRIPAGHVEGHFVAFANIYKAFITAINDKTAGNPVKDDAYPGVDYGIAGNRFVEKCVQSSKMGSVWVQY